VGAPNQAANIDAAFGGVPEHLPGLRVRAASETLIRVTAPVDEHQQVTVAHLRDPMVQLREVRRTMNQRTNQIALGPS